MKTLIDRFVEKIAEPADPHNDCWIWIGSTYVNKSGQRYGQIWVNGRHVSAHRVSHTLFVGPVPAGYVPDHLCENTLCVRPDHLEAVSQSVNRRRGKQGYGTHCKHGHPYDEANTYHRSDGSRRCRACHALEELKRRGVVKP